jgi:hypothetical protein
MRYLMLAAALFLAMPLHALRQKPEFTPPPAGQTIPISLRKALHCDRAGGGQQVSADLMQRVPLSATSYLPRQVTVVGKVVACDSSSISILLTDLRWKGRSLPIHLQLIAAASLNSVLESTMPLGATDRGTADPASWTTRQIGGDEVYRSAGSGKVYNQYSEPVGFADLHGVYQDPPAGELPRAMGPFSTTVKGLHGLTGFTIVSPGGANAPVVLKTSLTKWQIAGGSALLMKVVP